MAVFVAGLGIFAAVAVLWLPHRLCPRCSLLRFVLLTLLIEVGLVAVGLGAIALVAVLV